MSVTGYGARLALAWPRSHLPGEGGPRRRPPMKSVVEPCGGDGTIGGQRDAGLRCGQLDAGQHSLDEGRAQLSLDVSDLVVGAEQARITTSSAQTETPHERPAPAAPATRTR